MELSLEKTLAGITVLRTITTELLEVIARAPINDHKESHIHRYLDAHIDDKILLTSFDQIVVLIYDEALPVEVLTSIHTWVNKKACNISNFVLITTHTLGADAWYDSLTKLTGERRLNIIEAPMISNRYSSRLAGVSLANTQKQKNIQYYFSFYGGSYGSLERDFLVAMYLNCPIPKWVDYLAGFTSGPVEFMGYLEQVTGFMDKETVDVLYKIQQQTKLSSIGEVNEAFNTNGVQSKIDSVSACQVIRETLNTTPYTIITEKTIRSFLHNQHAIPLSGVNSVSQLEQIGFKFDYDLISYEYQSETIFYNRVHAVSKAMCALAENYTLAQLENIINEDSKGVLQHNYNYVATGDFFKHVILNVTNKIQQLR